MMNCYLIIRINGFLYRDDVSTAFDPSIAPGTGTPSHGGFLYYEVLEFLAGLAEHGNVKGMDLVEVSPPHDQTGITSILAAQILMNAVGRIFY